MDLDAIAVFVKVVETGGFSAAARALNMPKTTVSAKVAALEKRLGASLIQRTTRKLWVTEAGEKYFHHCANAVREIELGESALQAAQEKPSGLLKVTVPVDIGRTVMPAITHAYLEKYPETRVEISVTNRMVDIVGEGFDLAIRVGMLKDSSLIARRFFDLRVGLYASPAYLQIAGPFTQTRQLSRARFVIHPGFKSVRLEKAKANLEVPVECRVVADDMETVKALAMTGEGIAVLPDFLAADAVNSGELVPILPGWKVKTVDSFYFVHAVRKYTSPKVQAFIELAIEMRQKQGF